MTNTSKQRNAVIMFTDIVGYSAMIGKNEPHALKLLDEHNQTIEPTITSHNGRIIKHIGDAIFAEFCSPIDAVDASLVFQNKFREKNSLSRKEDQVQVRVGIHYGKVVVKENDLFGDVVNISNRIESIAFPGGIAISEEINNNLTISKYKTRPIGYVKLKNIKYPQNLYNLYLNHKEWSSNSQNELNKAIDERGIEVVDMNNFSPRDDYSIAIRYFVDLSTEKEAAYSYELTKGIINCLDKINNIRVSSFIDVSKYKNSELSGYDLALKLDVENLVEGSIFYNGESFEINYRMLDMRTGKEHINEQIISKALNDRVKGELLSELLTSLGIDIPISILNFISMEQTRNNEALNYYQKGNYIYSSMQKKEDLLVAKELYEKAFEIDRRYVSAIIQLGMVEFKLGHYEKSEEMMNLGMEFAKELNNTQGESNIYNYLGILYNGWGKYNKAIEYYKKALKIQIKLSDFLAESKLYHNLAVCFNNLNEPETALQYFNKSISIKEELNETNSLGPSYAMLANTYIQMGDLSIAVKNAKLAIGVFNSIENIYNAGRSFVILTEIYIDLGRLDDAIKTLEKSRSMCETFDEHFIMGKLDILTGKILFNKGQFEEAISCYESGLDRIQISDNQYYIMLYTLEQAINYLYNMNLKKSILQLNKASFIAKKIKNIEAEIYLNCIRALIDSSNSDGDVNRIDVLEKKLSNLDDLNIHIYYLFLANCYDLIGENEKKDALIQNAEMKLDTVNSLISNKEDIDFFMTNLLINRNIKNGEMPIGSIDSEDILKPKSNKFCSNCGELNEGQINFCPNCGNNLVS